MGKVRAAISNHWKQTTYRRSERTLASERWLFVGLPLVPFNRWALIPSAFLIQMCVGSLYAWSGFNAPIEQYVYGVQAVNGRPPDLNIAPVTFYIAVVCFGVAAAILGPWTERHGPRAAIHLGATLFFVGNLITAAGISLRTIALVYVGYGVVGGTGLGIAYISPVSVLQKWFPDRRGITAGLTVAGFGAGTIVATYTQKALMAPIGPGGPPTLDVYAVFLVLGTAYFMVMQASGRVLRIPPPNYAVDGVTVSTIKGADELDVDGEDDDPAGNDAFLDDDVPPVSRIAVPDEILSTTLNSMSLSADAVAAPDDDDDADVAEASTAPTVDAVDPLSMSLTQCLLSRPFLLLYVAFFGNQICGLLLISKIQTISMTQFGMSVDAATSVNAAVGAANLCGRFLLSTASDRIGRKSSLLVSLAVQTLCIALLLVTFDAESSSLFLACVAVIAFMYGGGFGVVPAFLSDLFGARHTGPTHGVILTAWSLAAVVGGLLFTSLYNRETAALGAHNAHVYDLNGYWILGVVVVALLVGACIPANIRDRVMPRGADELFRLRLPNGTLAVVTRACGLDTVDKETEDAQWKAYVRQRRQAMP
ncbi:Major facilitator superfamily (MFS) profile domain-containing protein [Plasmodiophora brassicae]